MTKAGCDLINHLTPIDGSLLTEQSMNGKGLLDRTTGRFYTHEIMGKHLAKSIAQAFLTRKKQPKIKIVEPFVGDGRLVCWLLEELAQQKNSLFIQYEVHIWETDYAALQSAYTAICECAKKLTLNMSITHIHADTFALSRDYWNQFDICITNPPWENLKPDQRELKYLSEADQSTYIQLLKNRASMLAGIYPNSQPSRKFSGWGTNLSRCGAELAFKLVNEIGIVGIVLPSSILADQTSGILRNWLFQEFSAIDLAYYVAEARLFEKVDQSSITFVATAQKTQVLPKLWSYDRNCHSTKVKLLNSDWEEVKRSEYIFPAQFNMSAVRVAAKLKCLSKFGDLEGSNDSQLWSGRELDETNYSQYLSSHGEHLFLKGRMIKRFGITEQPNLYISPNGPKIPKSVDFHRLVWRDVSRPSQKRRVYATIIPPGWVTGNSLHVAYFRDDNLARLKALLGIVNSLAFECQAKTYLATGHVSLGAVRRVPIPAFSSPEILDSLVPVVDLALAGQGESELLLEVLVAKLYGLTRDDFCLVLQSFDKVSKAEREVLLAHPAWS